LDAEVGIVDFIRKRENLLDWAHRHAEEFVKVEAEQYRALGLRYGAVHPLN